MENIGSTVKGVFVALILLVVLWFLYSDRFSFSLSALRNETACHDFVDSTRDKVILEFEQEALQAISGNPETASIEETKDPSHWAPTMQSLRALFNPNIIVDRAVSAFRRDIAENQKKNPESTLNKHKATLQEIFTNLDRWCEALPEGNKSSEDSV